MTTVVVVEDEILCEDLAAEGYEVLTADNADQAYRDPRIPNDITTIFTDIEMPGSMNGLKLPRPFATGGRPVNIVITTGKVRPPDDQMPTNSRFVAKPYQKAKVLEAFRPRGYPLATRRSESSGWRELAAPNGDPLGDLRRTGGGCARELARNVWAHPPPVHGRGGPIPVLPARAACKPTRPRRREARQLLPFTSLWGTPKSAPPERG